MLRQLRPERVIEIGYGYSTLLLPDTLDQMAPTDTTCVCIEPYPDLLHSLLTPEDHSRVEIHACEAQGADLAWFDALPENDILFIDSTHVSKTGSDVNYELFEILPLLNAGGVYIHFHDIYFPFEYPKEWVYQGRNWNEAYLVRAFLQYNNEFKIACFNSYLGQMHPELFAETDPMFLKHHGSSLWIRRGETLP
jgi:predicted O-methyltransferase YrrM